MEKLAIPQRQRDDNGLIALGKLTEDGQSLGRERDTVCIGDKPHGRDAPHIGEGYYVAQQGMGGIVVNQHHTLRLRCERETRKGCGQHNFRGLFGDGAGDGHAV